MKQKNIILVILIAFTIYCIHTLTKHFAFQSQAFDLGVYNQYFWLLNNGYSPYSTLNNNHLFANHFEPFLILLLPIYRLFPTPIILLITQSLFVSISAYPIYLVAKKHLVSELTSIIITVSFLTSLGLLYAINYDFHTSTLSVLPLSWIIYALDNKRTKLLLCVIITTILFKEDQIYFAFTIGIYLFVQKSYRVGIILIIISLITYTFIYNFFSPIFIAEINEHTITSHQNNLALFGQNTPPIDTVYKILTPPSKFLLPLILYSEHLFLSLGNGFATLITFPHIFLRLFSHKTSYWELTWHYNANIQPFLIYGVIITISTIKNKSILKLIIPIITSFMILRLTYVIILPTYYNLQQVQSHYSASTFLSAIPKEASVATDYFTNPHTSSRKNLYLCPNIELNHIDYLVIDQRLPDSPCKNLLQEKHQLIFIDSTIRVYGNKLNY